MDVTAVLDAIASAQTSGISVAIAVTVMVLSISAIKWIRSAR